MTYELDYSAYATFFELQGYSKPTPTDGEITMDMGVRSN